MTRCAYVESRLRALTDGELEPGESRKVLDHMDHCAACRSRHAALQSLTALLQDQELEDVPAHFSASLQVRLARHRREREEKAQRAGWLRRFFGVSRRVGWASAGLVMAAAVVCVLAFSTRIQASEVARKAGERWSQIRNYGCVFISEGVYQGQPRRFEQSQFYRKPGEFRLDTRQDYRLTTYVYTDHVIHYLPGGDWKGVGPLVIVRPRQADQDALPFPFGVTWQNGGNVSLDQLVRQLAQNDREARVVGEENVGEHACYRVAFSAVPPGGTQRDQYELWIDKESFLPRRVSWYRDDQNHIVTEAQQLQVNYDVVPAGTFDFRIPDGAAVIHGDADPHVLALPVLKLQGVSYADPVASAEAEGWNRIKTVPFQIRTPHWMPEGFELIRARRKVGRWLDLHWIRKSGDTYGVVKLVEQDGGLDWSGDLSDAREVNLGTDERPIIARAALRTVPYRHVHMSWRQGGTRFILTAADVTWDEALRIARSMRPVSPPEQGARVATQRAEGASPAAEPSVIPTAPDTANAAEVRPEEPADGTVELHVPTAAEQHQPPMMPEMADEDPMSVKEMAGPMR